MLSQLCYDFKQLVSYLLPKYIGCSNMYLMPWKVVFSVKFINVYCTFSFDSFLVNISVVSAVPFFSFEHEGLVGASAVPDMFLLSHFSVCRLKFSPNGFIPNHQIDMHMCMHCVCVCLIRLYLLCTHLWGKRGMLYISTLWKTFCLSRFTLFSQVKIFMLRFPDLIVNGLQMMLLRYLHVRFN